MKGIDLKKCLKLIIIGCTIFSLILCDNIHIYGEIKLNDNEIHAKYACLLDADNNRVLYSKSSDIPVPNASTTKIITCILALEYAELEEIITISDYAASQPDVQLNAKSKDTYLMIDLLYSMMLESHNDVTVAVAEHIGEKVIRNGVIDSSKDINTLNKIDKSKYYVDAFSILMNKKACEIGCKNTFFVTSNGLDSIKDDKEHSSSAYDLAIILKYCIMQSQRSEMFLRITRQSAYTFSNIKNTRTHTVRNRNALLNMMQGALTGKTGFTGKAGYCYVGAVQRDGKTYIVSLLACGWPGNKNYKWADMKKIINYAYTNYKLFDVSKMKIDLHKYENIVINNAQTNRLYEDYILEVELKESMLKKRIIYLKDTEKIILRYSFNFDIDAPFNEGDVIGRVEYVIDDYIFFVNEIICKNSSKKKDLLWYITKVTEIYMMQEEY